jgi:hypothetical protein
MQLSEKQREAVYAVMRDCDNTAETGYEENRRLSPRFDTHTGNLEIAVGGSHMDGLFLGEGIRGFLNGINVGLPPMEAAEAGNGRANYAIEKWNHSRKDYQVHRALDTIRPRLHDMARRCLRAGASRPSIGTTRQTIFDAWKNIAQSAMPPRATIECLIVGTGRFDWRNDKIVRLETFTGKRGNVSTYRDATDEEIAEIWDAIDKGQFQLEQRTIRGALGIRQFSDAGNLEKVIHQATGDALQEFLDTEEGQAWAKRVHSKGWRPNTKEIAIALYKATSDKPTKAKILCRMAYVEWSDSIVLILKKLRSMGKVRFIDGKIIRA